MKYRNLRGYKYETIEDDSFCIGPVILLKETSSGVFDSPFIRIDCLGNITIKKGYAWDGCSGPTWDDKTNMVPGRDHDAGYQLMRMGVLSPNYRGLFDQRLHDGMVARGAWGFRADYYKAAVSQFAKTAATRQNPKDTEIIEIL